MITSERVEPQSQRTQRQGRLEALQLLSSQKKTISIPLHWAIFHVNMKGEEEAGSQEDPEREEEDTLTQLSNSQIPCNNPFIVPAEKQLHYICLVR